MAILSVWFLLFAGSRAFGEIYYGQGEFKAPQELVDEWIKGCGKDDVHSCYNLGVHYAQTERDEPAALPFYRRACLAGSSPGCANLGGLLIKEISTRGEGIAAFQRSCKLSKSVRLSKEDKKALSESCRWSRVAKRYEKRPYFDLYLALEADYPSFCDTGVAEFDDALLLHGAAASGDLGLVKSLLAKGKNMDEQDDSGATPLFLAAANNRIRTTEFLLSRKADADLKTKTGDSPYFFAKLCDFGRIAGLLKDHVADLDPRDKWGFGFEDYQKGASPFAEQARAKMREINPRLSCDEVRRGHMSEIAPLIGRFPMDSHAEGSIRRFPMGCPEIESTYEPGSMNGTQPEMNDQVSWVRRCGFMTGFSPEKALHYQQDFVSGFDWCAEPLEKYPYQVIECVTGLYDDSGWDRCHKIGQLEKMPSAAEVLTLFREEKDAIDPSMPSCRASSGTMRVEWNEGRYACASTNEDVLMYGFSIESVEYGDYNGDGFLDVSVGFCQLSGSGFPCINTVFTKKSSDSFWEVIR